VTVLVTDRRFNDSHEKYMKLNSGLWKYCYEFLDHSISRSCEDLIELNYEQGGNLLPGDPRRILALSDRQMNSLIGFSITGFIFTIIAAALGIFSRRKGVRVRQEKYGQTLVNELIYTLKMVKFLPVFNLLFLASFIFAIMTNLMAVCFYSERQDHFRNDACHAKDFRYEMSWGYSFHLSIFSGLCYFITIAFGLEKYIYRSHLIQSTLQTEKNIAPSQGLSCLVKGSLFTANAIPNSGIDGSTPKKTKRSMSAFSGGKSYLIKAGKQKNRYYGSKDIACMNNPNVRHLLKNQPKLRQTQLRSQSVDVTPAQMDRRRVDRNFDLPEIMEDLEEEFRKRLKNEEKIIEKKSTF